MKEKYNERLFSNGIRKWIHMSRFHWLKEKCLKYKPSFDVVVELGCYDGRSIEYFPEKPVRYYGFDANWEGGLDIARNNAAYENYAFVKSLTDNDLMIEEKNASLVISLETFEHIPDEVLNGYIRKISLLLNGYLIVTVPNEKGGLFLGKYLIKRFFWGGEKEYRLKEVLFATFGKMGYVKREEHKGFDWELLLSDLKEKFDLVEVQGVQFPFMPTWVNAQIGFVFKSR